jgi:hypothetical protein
MRLLQSGLMTAWLLASTAVWATEPSQIYQQMRSQATLLAVNALLYFDADPQVHPDERHLVRVNEAQKRLDAMALQLEPNMQVGDSLASLHAWLAELQALPRRDAPRYPQLLIGLLDTRLKLDRQLGEAYAQLESTPPVARQLNQQSLTIGSLLLDAQARSARLLGDHSLAYSEAELIARDQVIQQGFTTLMAELPEHAKPLYKQRSAYRFVRERLLDRAPGRVTGSLERYLAGVLVALDDLAEAQGATPPL